MLPCRCALLVLFLSEGLAGAQVKQNEVQPNFLALGTVYVGATVEASFLVRDPGAKADVKFEVAAPKFVKLLDKCTEVRRNPNGDFVAGTVEIAINTATAGEFKGDVSVTLGGTEASVPVSVTVKPRRPRLRHVLIVGSPFEAYATSDGAMYEQWSDLVKNSPLSVDYLLVHRDKAVLRELNIQKYDCVLLSAGGLFWATPADIKRAREYAEQGGRVILTANAFYMGTVRQANKVLAGYGLEMRDEEGPGMDGKGNAMIETADFDPQVVNAGVKTLHFFRASPTAVTDAAKAKVLVKAAAAGKPGDAFIASARAGKGEIIALGQSLWCFWISEERAKESDNAKLLGWLLAPPDREPKDKGGAP